MAVGDLEYVKVAPDRLSNTIDTTLYTIPASRMLVHLDVVVCNTDPTTEYLFDLHLVPNGGSLSDDNQIINGVANRTGALLAGETKAYSFDQFLEAGATIRGGASTTDKLAVHMSAVLRVTA